MPEKYRIVLTFTPAAPYKNGHSTIDYCQQNEITDNGNWLYSSMVAGYPTHWAPLEFPDPKPEGVNYI